MKKPLVSVIVLNWNGKRYLKNCFESLARQMYTNLEVIMIDNNSTDESIDLITTNFPWVKVVKNNENLGVAQGYNEGVKYAEGEFIVFVNNDMVFARRWLEELVITAQSSPSIGIIGSKILLLDQNSIIDSVGTSLDKYGFPSYPGHGEADRGQYDFIRTSFAVLGASLLVKRKVITKIGLFDDAFFAMSEDWDFCWRARLAGYECMINPHSVAYHKCGGARRACSTKISQRYQTRFFSEAHALRSLLKNYSKLTLVVILPRYFAILFAEFLILMLLGRPKVALASLRAVVWNLKKLKDTWQSHLRVQSMRVVDDRTIKQLMINRSLKLFHATTFVRDLRLGTKHERSISTEGYN